MIKKLFFITLFVGLISDSVSAQVESFQIGFKVGFSLADFKGEETDNLDPRTSVHVGLAAEIPINEILAIQPELLYTFQGVKTESEEVNFEKESTKLDYIYLPVMVKYYPFYVVPGFSLEAGPQVGFLTSAVLERRNNLDGGITETSDTDIKDITSSIDVGFNLGVGYQLEIGAFIQARYNLGITDVFDIEGLEVSQQHSVFQFSTGFKF